MDLEKCNALKAELASEPDPLVPIDRFFDGNDDPGSVGCNLSEHPGVDRFREVLVGLTRRPDVQAVYAQIAELDPDEDAWPFTDTVLVVGTIDSDTLADLVGPLQPDEVGPAAADIPPAIREQQATRRGRDGRLVGLMPGHPRRRAGRAGTRIPRSSSGRWASAIDPRRTHTRGETASVQDQQPIAYEAPGARDVQRRARSGWYLQLAGQLLIAFVVFVGSVVLCAVGGGLLGRVIAALFPRYYPSVFPAAATQPEFDAVQVGVATGVGQGAAAGVFVGAVIVLALAVANWRRLRPQV
jgi:hypothetical protein